MFALDRAGLVGSDGETHQGIFDLSYLSSIPNMHIMAPKNKWELADMMAFALDFGCPIAIRYPRGTAYDKLKEQRDPIVYGKGELLYEGGRIALLAVGSMVKTALEVREMFKEESGLDVTVVNARFIKPVDTKIIESLVERHSLFVTMEENVLSGGYGEKVLSYLTKEHPEKQVINIALPDTYIEHGNVEILKKETGIDAQSVFEKIQREIQRS